jgi:hypothetical protein
MFGRSGICCHGDNAALNHTASLTQWRILKSGAPSGASAVEKEVSQLVQTVAKASLTITAASLSQVAGRAQPALTAIYAGLVNGETAAVLTAQPQLSTASTGSVGSAAIEISGATADDYAIVYQAGTLTVIADTPSFAVLSSNTAPLAGDTPTYTVTILSAIDGQTITAGTVQFRFDGVDQGSPVSLDSNGSASFTAAPLAAGSHTITAVYSGDAANAGSTSSALTQVVS